MCCIWLAMVDPDQQIRRASWRRGWLFVRNQFRPLYLMSQVPAVVGMVSEMFPTSGSGRGSAQYRTMC
jgi:hypothetical protein